MVIKGVRPPIQPEGAVFMAAPRKAAKVKRGPGTICTAP